MNAAVKSFEAAFKLGEYRDAFANAGELGIASGGADSSALVRSRRTSISRRSAAESAVRCCSAAAVRSRFDLLMLLQRGGLQIVLRREVDDHRVEFLGVGFGVEQVGFERGDLFVRERGVAYAFIQF